MLLDVIDAVWGVLEVGVVLMALVGIYGLVETFGGWPRRRP